MAQISQDTVTVARYPSKLKRVRLSSVQKAWLARGLKQPGGKLPLFDKDGQHYDARTIRACIDQGWAEPWFGNPLKPDWLVCRITDAGRQMIEGRNAD